MLIFGIDVPLVQIELVFFIVTFILLAEAVIIVSLMIKQLQKTKQMLVLLEKLSETILSVKKLEIDQLDRLKKIR